MATARSYLALFALAITLSLAGPAAALEECRLLRQPDIQGDRIVFTYAGDLWTVGRAGGVATRLTTDEGNERFPKLSPDGATVAFTGDYDGNSDAFTIPVTGGEPKRLTWHPGADQVADWYPDGRSLLVRSPRNSPLRPDHFFRVPASGGFEEPLGLPSSGYASIAADGKRMAFVYPDYDNRTWKRYKGGNAPDVWVYDFSGPNSWKITDWEGADEWPMWHGESIYYCTDKGGGTANVWAYDLGTKTHRQVTRFTEYDVKWPSIGGDAIVFENGGNLYVMDLPGEKPVKVPVLVPDDKPGARAEYRNVSDWITGFDLSPSGKRAVIEARGEIFTVPAEKGDPRNVTGTPGARERDPVWSPDGKWIAYHSDASGEYEVHVVGSDGKTPDRQVTKGATTFRFELAWSPDSKKLAFSDKTRTLWLCDVASGDLTRIDKSDYAQIRDFSWSGDSRWIAYVKTEANYFGKIQLYSLASGKSTAFSDGMTDDFSPSFDPEGRWLYFVSRRKVDLPAFSFEYNFPLAKTDKLYAATLQDTTASPVAPESDEEEGADAAEDEDDEKGKGKDDKKDDEKKSEAAWKIDLDGIGARVAELPVPAGRYAVLRAFADQVLFLEMDEIDVDADGPPTATLRRFDLKKREVKTALPGIDAGFATTKDGAKVLYKSGETFGIVEVAEEAKSGDGKIETGALMALVDPRAEWRQMFDEAWRLERDFYYDPAMGGIDWRAIGERYRQLVPYVAHRADLNYILGELLGELSTSHAYVGGGDAPHAPQVDVGLLGADYALDASSGRYRFAKIYRHRDWNSDVPAPLAEPGLNVDEGDYLLAVNGRPVKAPENVHAAFVGTKGQATALSIGKSPNDAKPRTVVVVPIGSEKSLRYTAWVTANREHVAKATDGRIAYIHVPNTAMAGIEEFTKQYYPQTDRSGIIVDERWNGGGFIPDFFVERLQRHTLSYWSTRDGDDFRSPGTAIDGPKCILVNQYAGSGGDAFPHYFRLAGLGPVIGKRTWGGLVGISQSLPLVDGGAVTMPDFGMWDPKSGEWLIENHGVDPDIDIENPPHEVAAGRDAQLERAIQYCNEELKTNPPRKPPRPKYKVRVEQR